ncbi:MAG: phosphatidylglycerol lysyltransferase domain-containing protein [Peptococcaceae bacterium]|nr:phosphatidylglycerol lysyltransferase domain-containing protein [Peptococcaceae bacterium]
MIEFKNPGLPDREWVLDLLRSSDYQGCEYTFGNLFIWGGVFGTKIARYKDFYLIKNRAAEAQPTYSYPAGRGDFREALELLAEDAREAGYRFVLSGLTENKLAVIGDWAPDGFEVKPVRGFWDYIYRVSDLIELKGSKFQPKRNHINRFIRENDWSYEALTLGNLQECRDMNDHWEEENMKRDPSGLSHEKTAIQKAFDYFEALGLEGGVLRSNGKVVAYTMGERLNSNTFCTHIEKADRELHGAYSMMNHEFAVNHLSGYTYVNREEDMDNPGLRRSKLSYHPEIILEKHRAEF